MNEQQKPEPIIYEEFKPDPNIKPLFAEAPKPIENNAVPIIV